MLRTPKPRESPYTNSSTRKIECWLKKRKNRTGPLSRCLEYRAVVGSIQPLTICIDIIRHKKNVSTKRKRRINDAIARTEPTVFAALFAVKIL